MSKKTEPKKSDRKGTTAITFYLDDDVDANLEAAMVAESRTKTAILNLAALEYLIKYHPELLGYPPALPQRKQTA